MYAFIYFVLDSDSVVQMSRLVAGLEAKVVTSKKLNYNSCICKLTYNMFTA